MATEFDGSMRIPADTTRTFQMLSDPEYVMWKHENMAAFDITATVHEEDEDIVITSSRKLPAQIPAAAKALVGEAIHIHEVTTWGPAATDGSRSGTVSATFGSAPMSVGGTISLRPDGETSLVEIEILAKAGIPLLGGKLETVAGEQFLRALNKEERLAPEWLAK